MKKFRKVQMKRCLAVLLLLTLTATQCVTPTVAEAATKKTVVVKSIKLDQKSLNLDKGKAVNLKITIAPKAAKNAKLVWKSSKPKVAAVNAKGRVTAKQAGTAKITVTAKGTKKSASCTVKVLTAVSKVTVSPSKATLKIKERITLKTKITPTNTSYKTLVYQSANPKIVAVNRRGIIEGRRTGKTRIVVQVKNTTKKVSVPVTVLADETPSTSEPSDSEPSALQPSTSEPTPSHASEPSTSISQPIVPNTPSETPTEPSKEESKPSEPGKEESKPSEPSKEESKPAEPSKEESEPVEPSKEESKPVEPSKEESKPSETSTLEEPSKEESKPSETSTPEEPSKEESKPSETSTPEEPSKEESKPSETSTPEEPSKEESKPSETSTPEEPSKEESKPSETSTPAEPSKEESKPSETSTPSEPSKEESKPSTEEPSEDPSDTDTLKSLKKELSSQIKTLNGMKEDFADEEQKKNVEMMIASAENVYKTSKDEGEVKNQVEMLTDFCEICWKGVSPYAYADETSVSYDQSLDKDKNFVLKVIVKKGQKERVTFKPNSSGGTVKVQKASVEGYENELVVTAANSYTRVYEIVIEELPENPLSIKAVTDAEGVIDHWHTYLKDKTEDSIEMAMGVSGYSETGLTDAFSVVPKQKNAKVEIEDYNVPNSTQKYPYLKKVTLSAENSIKTVYYVYYYRSDEWEIKSLRYGDTVCKPKSQMFSYSDEKGYIQLEEVYQEGLELTVEPFYSDVQWKVEDSDQPGYQKKIILSRNGESISYYVAFTDEADRQYILDIYVNGILQKNWSVSDNRVNGTNQHIVSLSGLQNDDEIEVVPVSEETSVVMSDSDQPDYIKKITLTTGEKTKVYYLQSTKVYDEEDTFSIQKITVDGVEYVRGSSSGADNYFSDYTRHTTAAQVKEIELSGLEQPKWESVVLTVDEENISAKIEDSDISFCEKKLTFTWKGQEKIYYIGWTLSDSVWNLSSVSLNGEIYQEGDYYEKKDKTFYLRTQPDYQRDYLNEDVDGTLMLYGDYTELPADVQFQPVHADTKVELQDNLLRMSYKGNEKLFFVECMFPAKTWQIASLQIGAQTCLPRNAGISNADCYFDTYSDSVYLYGVQNISDIPNMQVTTANPEVKATVSPYTTEYSESIVAKINMEYQGQKETIIVYCSQVKNEFSIKQIAAGDWTYLPGYIRDSETSGDSQSENNGIFSQSSYSDRIEISGMARSLGNELQFTMDDPSITVKVEESDQDGAEKKVIFTKGDRTKVYYLHYQIDPNAWKFAEVKAGATTFAWRSSESSYAEEPYFTTQKYYESLNIPKVNELLIYGTEKELDTNFTVTPEKASVEVAVSDTDRSGYTKKVTLKYGKYHKTYFVKYDALPKIWSVASVQAGEITYTNNRDDNGRYFEQMDNKLVIYGTEKEFPTISTAMPDNPEVKAEISDKKVTLTYGTLKKELTLDYQLVQSVWKLKTVQAGEQIYEAGSVWSGMDYHYYESTKYNDGKYYEFLCLSGLESQLPGELKIEAENPEVTMQAEDSDWDEAVKKVTMTYGEFTKVYYISYEVSENVCDLLQIKDGTDVYERYDSSAEEKQDIYFETSSYYDPEDTDNETTKRSVVLYGYRESLGSELSVLCKSKDAVVTVEDCSIADKEDDNSENTRMFTKKITAECAGNKIIYFVCYQLQYDFWDIKEIRDGDTVYSSDDNAKNYLYQKNWNNTLDVCGEKDALSSALNVVLKVSEKYPDIQVTCDYVDGVLTLHYGALTKSFDVSYSKITSVDDDYDDYDD